MRCRHVGDGDADHANVVGSERLVAGAVVVGDRRIVVHAAIDLERQPKLSAVEVDDERADHLLTAELEPEATTATQERPRQRLGRSRRPPQLARPLGALPRDRNPADDARPASMGKVHGRRFARTAQELRRGPQRASRAARPRPSPVEGEGQAPRFAEERGGEDAVAVRMPPRCGCRGGEDAAAVRMPRR